mmetsp:Transcript_40643/g.121237  ORF Transcript_40643/g.121237 Transcript_40643/m.121237 type:complete len:212 (+) Transcript_40643:253-888(+)
MTLSVSLIFSYARSFFLATSRTLAVMVNARDSSSSDDGRPRCRLRSSQSCSCRRMKGTAPSPYGARIPRARQAARSSSSVSSSTPSSSISRSSCFTCRSCALRRLRRNASVPNGAMPTNWHMDTSCTRSRFSSVMSSLKSCAKRMISAFSTGWPRRTLLMKSASSLAFADPPFLRAMSLAISDTVSCRNLASSSLTLSLRFNSSSFLSLSS